MLRNRQFLFLWFVNIATTLAIELFTITILVTIYEQTESTLQATGTMIARTKPAFLLGSVAGVLVDRFSRKNMLISMDLIQLALVGIAIWFLQGDGKVPIAGIFFAGLSDFVSIRVIYVTGGIIYILTGFYALSNKALRENKMNPNAGRNNY